ncbi:MAG: hypothetical protein DRI34_07270 [Deltaproteobacteria bacterium]|nr:MAG: hypothetical protein DRI34_07270 [Deltaproteobacteria bacterium]
MSDELSAAELVALVRRAFLPSERDRSLAFLVDVPASAEADNPAWRQRRQLAADWAGKLAGAGDELGLGVRLVFYEAVGANNADLPGQACYHPGGRLPTSAAELAGLPQVALEQVLADNDILIAPTEYSATAPLKLAAPRLGFRAATMPGFSPSMVAALRIDYGEVNRRVELLSGLLTRAQAAEIEFSVTGGQFCRLFLDLRRRRAHSSGGFFPRPGNAGNLPSGESYIVPYEGEEDPSRSSGLLPVQFGDEVVYYRIENNRAREVEGDGPAATREAEHLRREPAYGNLAELGLGVLGDFGLEPSGEILLDEKLGLHIAFGRSDHFGGQVGAKDFSSPREVVHIDRVYVPQLQPDVEVSSARLVIPGEEAIQLIRDGRYVVDFSSAEPVS